MTSQPNGTSPTATATATDNSRPAPPKTSVLTLNAGSSSLKFALFSADSPVSPVVSGAINGVGSTLATFTLKGLQGEVLERAAIAAPDPVVGLAYLLARLR